MNPRTFGNENLGAQGYNPLQGQPGCATYVNRTRNVMHFNFIRNGEYNINFNLQDGRNFPQDGYASSQQQPPQAVNRFNSSVSRNGSTPSAISAGSANLNPFANQRGMFGGNPAPPTYAVQPTGGSQLPPPPGLFPKRGPQHFFP